MLNITVYGTTIHNTITDILAYFNLEEPSEDEVWQEARKEKEIPCFNNVFLEMMLKQVEKAIQQKRPDINIRYELDNEYTALWMNDKKITFLHDFKTSFET